MALLIIIVHHRYILFSLSELQKKMVLHGLQHNHQKVSFSFFFFYFSGTDYHSYIRKKEKCG